MSQYTYSLYGGAHSESACTRRSSSPAEAGARITASHWRRSSPVQTPLGLAHSSRSGGKFCSTERLTLPMIRRGLGTEGGIPARSTAAATARRPSGALEAFLAAVELRPHARLRRLRQGRPHLARGAGGLPRRPATPRESSTKSRSSNTRTRHPQLHRLPRPRAAGKRLTGSGVGTPLNRREPRIDPGVVGRRAGVPSASGPKARGAERTALTAARSPPGPAFGRLAGIGPGLARFGGSEAYV